MARPIGAYESGTLTDADSLAFKRNLKEAAANYGIELQTLPENYPFPAGKPTRYSQTWLWNHLSLKRRIRREDARRLFVMLIRHPQHRKANPTLTYASYLTPHPETLKPTSVHERALLRFFPWIVRLAPEEIPHRQRQPWDKPPALISPYACDRLAELMADTIARQKLPRGRDRREAIRKIIRKSLRSSAFPMAEALYMRLQIEIGQEKRFGRTHKHEGKIAVIHDLAALWWTAEPREQARQRRSALRRTMGTIG